MPIEELIPQEIEDIPAAIQATLAATRPAAHDTACTADTQPAPNFYYRERHLPLYQYGRLVHCPHARWRGCALCPGSPGWRIPLLHAGHYRRGCRGGHVGFR